MVLDISKVILRILPFSALDAEILENLNKAQEAQAAAQATPDQPMIAPPELGSPALHGGLGSFLVQWVSPTKTDPHYYIRIYVAPELATILRQIGQDHTIEYHHVLVVGSACLSMFSLKEDMAAISQGYTSAIPPMVLAQQKQQCQTLIAYAQCHCPDALAALHPVFAAWFYEGNPPGSPLL